MEVNDLALVTREKCRADETTFDDSRFLAYLDYVKNDIIHDCMINDEGFRVKSATLSVSSRVADLPSDFLRFVYLSASFSGTAQKVSEKKWNDLNFKGDIFAEATIQSTFIGQYRFLFKDFNKIHILSQDSAITDVKLLYKPIIPQITAINTDDTYTVHHIPPSFNSYIINKITQIYKENNDIPISASSDENPQVLANMYKEAMYR